MCKARWLLAFCAAAASIAQTDPSDPPVPLTRIKRQMVAHLSRIANFTCLETIRRARSDRTGRIVKNDTLRLEVAFVDGKELFSRIGADKFEDRDIGEFGRGGAIGSGVFASLARGVFLLKSATYRYGGEETLRGRRSIRYSYDVPVQASGFEMNIGGERALLGFSGSFWADAETFELMRLTVRADDIPIRLKIARALQTIDYARVRLNDTDFLLPQHAETELTEISGGESRNHTEFSHWLQYVGESALVFDDPASTAGATDSKLQLPPGLALSTRLETEIRLNQAQVGDRITASVDQEARLKQKVIVPAGATLEGRIRAIEKPADPSGSFTLTLEFTELRISGRSVRFFARLSDVKAASNSARRMADEGLLGIAALQVKADPGHLRLIWKMGEI